MNVSMKYWFVAESPLQAAPLGGLSVKLVALPPLESGAPPGVSTCNDPPLIPTAEAR